MREIFIIGTIHDKFTNIEELKSILDKIKPDQLLVEITHNDILMNNFKSYPVEMIFSYKWGVNNKIKINGFDYEINILKNISKRRFDKITRNVIRHIKRLDWKDFNKKENRNLFYEYNEKILDNKKNIKRENMMLINIYNSMISNGKIVIITGAGHLDFFEKNIKGAVFPLEK